MTVLWPDYAVATCHRMGCTHLAVLSESWKSLCSAAEQDKLDEAEAKLAELDPEDEDSMTS